MKRYASIVETVPQPCQIFGTPLRPFCLGFHMLFHRLSLPFADNPSAECDALQFLKAVFTCAYSYEENLEGHSIGEWMGTFEEWTAKIKKKRGDIKQGIVVFRKYLKDGYRLPPIWMHHHKNQAHFTAPWEELLKCRLLMSGFSLTEVLNGYLVERWYDYFTLLEIAQAESTDPKNWKTIFYTKHDALQDEAASGGAA